jgi:hypothetical protein
MDKEVMDWANSIEDAERELHRVGGTLEMVQGFALENSNFLPSETVEEKAEACEKIYGSLKILLPKITRIAEELDEIQEKWQYILIPKKKEPQPSPIKA